MHHGEQPRHLHYTDVMLSHIRVSLGLGLEELSLESKPGKLTYLAVLVELIKSYRPYVSPVSMLSFSCTTRL